jgi:GNAT superfamily N-acetyltransferase
MRASDTCTDSREGYPPGVPISLSDELVLRAVSSTGDIERLTEFNAKVNEDPAVGVLTSWWLSGTHPTLNPLDFLLVENTPTGEIVSTVGLLTETWAYEGIPLPVGRVELVGTHPDFRRQGLVQAQMAVIERMLKAKGCAMSCIAGIPHFYRQFGYEYAIPLDSCAHLSLDLPSGLPPQSNEPPPIRAMSPGTDLRQVRELYDAHAGELCITSLRNEALWRFQETAPLGIPQRPTTFVVEDRAGLFGYFRLRKNMWKPWMEFMEASVRPGGQVWGSQSALQAILQYGKDLAQQNGYSRLCFALPQSHPLVEYVRYLGAQQQRQYAWQVRIADHASFLRHLGPALERRITNSLLAGFSGVLDIDIFSRLIRIQFERGRLSTVVDAPRGSGESMLRLTPPMLTQLALGYRAIAELTESHLEASIEVGAHQLVDVLFPKTESFVYSAL